MFWVVAVLFGVRAQCAFVAEGSQDPVAKVQLATDA